MIWGVILAPIFQKLGRSRFKKVLTPPVGGEFYFQSTPTGSPHSGGYREARLANRAWRG